MKIVVCIKQVPDTTDIKVDPETGTLKRETAGTVMNPFDMYAVEEGLRIKEKLGGTVSVLTMGPQMAKEIIKVAIGMGVDDGYLLTDPKLAGSDTWATSYALSKAIQKIGFDIVLFGKQAIDGDTAQVGPSTAEYLNVPCITWVKKIREISGSEITVERMMEDGTDVVKSSIPVAITVVKEINEPRLESLKGKMRAKKYEPVVFDLKAIEGDETKVGLKNSPTRVKQTWSAKRQPGKAEMLTGEPDEIAEKLIGKLKEIGYLK
ncbi:MAG: electron transfer flavoprotein subunit beta/FixA family protein [Candidatus Goldbacteria bacterium]|nr:electron transfer flavoprotein subunit beta/FixA family protein [Candidatus Goldiibacteriota bacterium]